MTHIASNTPYYQAQVHSWNSWISYVYHHVLWQSNNALCSSLGPEAQADHNLLLVAYGLPGAGVPESAEFSDVWVLHSGAQVVNDRVPTQIVIMGKTTGRAY